MKVKLLSGSPKAQPNSSHHLHQYQSGGSAMTQRNAGRWRSWLLVMWTLKLENRGIAGFYIQDVCMGAGVRACALCVFTCASRGTVHSYVHVGGVMCMCVHADARGWRCLPSSIAPPVFYWGRVNLLPGSQFSTENTEPGASWHSLAALAPGFLYVS